LRELLPDLEIFLMYGLTECKRVSILRPQELDLKPGSVGQPLAGTEAFVVGAGGERLPPKEVGELVVRGRNVTAGYWKAPEETAARFRRNEDALGGDLVLHTGDLCWVDDDGFLHFVEREDNLMKMRGFRVSPIEIEDAACDISGVHEACVVKRGDDLHLFVSLVDRSVTESQLQLALSGRLESFKVPRSISVLPELPHTSNRKIDRGKLQHLAFEVLSS
jgi:acyl-CoA synthetase (AMP-forming)/AMP-acid ligase II